MRRKKREIVHVGRDGWLFLIGGTNGVLDQYRSTFSWWRLLRAWARLVEARAARARSLGITYLHFVVPEKLSIYEHRTDGLAYDPAKSPARRLARRLLNVPAYFDLLGPMRAARDGSVPLYYRTDTHWTYDGCLFAYRLLLRACGAVPPAGIGDRPRYETSKVRDLADKLPERQAEAGSHGVIDQHARRIYASPLVEAYEAAGQAPSLHVGAHVVYRNEMPEADPRTVVLFGDSYSHFAPIMFTGLLAETFREVHFVWSSSLDWTYIERIRPDLLIFEMAERFMKRLPDDLFDVERRGGRTIPAPAEPA
jgi:hypothetical protein